MSSKMRVLVGGSALVLASAAHAQTACPCGAGNLVTSPSALMTLLVGKTVCAASGGDTWQEYHLGSGTRGRVLDYKRGPNDPVDPTEAVGDYVIGNTAGTANISYDYGGGQIYTYTVCQNGASVNFCGARNIIGATLLTGQVPCGAAAQANRVRTPGS